MKKLMAATYIFAFTFSYYFSYWFFGVAKYKVAYKSISPA
jgi:hypothetical protein